MPESLHTCYFLDPVRHTTPTRRDSYIPEGTKMSTYPSWIFSFLTTCSLDTQHKNDSCSLEIPQFKGIDLLLFWNSDLSICSSSSSGGAAARTFVFKVYRGSNHKIIIINNECAERV